MFDSNFLMKDSGLVVESAAGTVGGTAKVAKVGAGIVEGKLIVDVTAIEIETSNEKFAIKLQGSVDNNFNAGLEDLVILELGAASALGGDADSEVGRYIVPFRNEKNATVYPYLRLYTDVTGGVTTGINFSAYLAK